MKLVLCEVPGAAEPLGHIGVEVSAAAEVDEAVMRLSAAGNAGEIEVHRTCCSARQSDGARKELHRVVADAERFAQVRWMRNAAFRYTIRRPRPLEASA